MKKVIFIITMSLLMCGCLNMNRIRIEAQERHCTEKQLEDVGRYVDVCSANDYLNTYCFDRAIVSICDSVLTEKK